MFALPTNKVCVSALSGSFVYAKQSNVIYFGQGFGGVSAEFRQNSAIFRQRAAEFSAPLHNYDCAQVEALSVHLVVVSPLEISSCGRRFGITE
jgi:hypothetical protein